MVSGRRVWAEFISLGKRAYGKPARPPMSSKQYIVPFSKCSTRGQKYLRWRVLKTIADTAIWVFPKNFPATRKHSGSRVRHLYYDRTLLGQSIFNLRLVHYGAIIGVSEEKFYIFSWKSRPIVRHSVFGSTRRCVPRVKKNIPRFALQTPLRRERYTFTSHRHFIFRRYKIGT